MTRMVLFFFCVVGVPFLIICIRGFLGDLRRQPPVSWRWLAEFWRAQALALQCSGRASLSLLLGASVSFAQTSPNCGALAYDRRRNHCSERQQSHSYGLAAAQCMRLPERRITGRALATGLKVTFGLFYRSSA